MKQTFAVVILVVILLFTSIYLFVPNKNNVMASIKSIASAGAIQRTVSNKTIREKWLPKEGKQLSDSVYTLDDCSFKFISDYAMNNVVIVKYRGIETNSPLLLSINGNESNLFLNFKIPSNNNPITKVFNYFNVKHIEVTIKKLLEHLNNFVGKNENIYGVDMQIVKLKDSTLITVKEVSTKYPTISQIYKGIVLLRSYAKAAGAQETNHPMLHILKNADSSFAYMVALPINKWLQNNGNIIGKRMLAGGNILESGDVKGGFYTVDKFLKEIENFRNDESRTSPAIPFQSLVTDRSLETDTSKWITKLYYPVF